MVKAKIAIVLKCILTGILYALVTCVVQVPVANALSLIIDIESDLSISDEMLPLLLFFIFIAGTAMALFFYLNAHLFSSAKKWKQGLKFALFVYFTNYIPQVFFLDANKGIKGLISGGFSVIQVELFDLIILVVTVLLMVTYMPCDYKSETPDIGGIGWKCLMCGCVYAGILVLLQEIVLPLFGFLNMASGLNVSKENMPFFYLVMILGFIMSGALVSLYVLKANDKHTKEKFLTGFAVLIWCTFDLTMIPLGFGVFATITFIIVSIIAFTLLKYVIISVEKTV